MYKYENIYLPVCWLMQKPLQSCADIFLVKRPIIVTMKVDQHNEISFYLRTYPHFIKLGSYKWRRFFEEKIEILLCCIIYTIHNMYKYVFIHYWRLVYNPPSTTFLCQVRVRLHCNITLIIWWFFLIFRLSYRNNKILRFYQLQIL